MASKRQFREHVGTSPGALCPRQDQIEDRRAFIAALGGVLVGAALGQGCGDDEKPAPKPRDSGGISVDINAPMDSSPHPETSGGLPDGPRAPLDTMGIPDMPKAPKDLGPPPPDATSGVPDMPGTPQDLKPPQKEMMPAGLPPLPSDLGTVPDK